MNYVEFINEAYTKDGLCLPIPFDLYLINGIINDLK